jgi:CDP-diacylglycerol--serine O-phosphatidyltransferase
VVFFIALLIGYPWHVLSICSVLYLASLPFGWKSYRDHERHAASVAAATAGAATPTTAEAATFTPAPSDTEDERPTRLN